MHTGCSWLGLGIVLGLGGCVDEGGRPLGEGDRSHQGGTDSEGSDSEGWETDDAEDTESGSCRATCRLLRRDNNGYAQPLDDRGDPLGPPPNSQGVPYMSWSRDYCSLDPWPYEQNEYDEDGDLIGVERTLSAEGRCRPDWDGLSSAYASHGEARRASLDLECDFSPECPSDAKVSARFTGEYEGRLHAYARGRYFNILNVATARAKAGARVTMPEAVISDGEEVRGYALQLQAASGYRSDELGCLLEVVDDVLRHCFVEFSTDLDDLVVGKCRINGQQLLDGLACFHDPTQPEEKTARFGDHVPSVNHIREVANGAAPTSIGDMEIAANYEVDVTAGGENWGFPITASAETRVRAALAVDIENSYCLPHGDCDIEWDGPTSVTLQLPDDYSADWDSIDDDD